MKHEIGKYYVQVYDPYGSKIPDLRFSATNLVEARKISNAHKHMGSVIIVRVMDNTKQTELEQASTQA